VCWSWTADLAAGGVITAVGVVAVAHVRRAGDLPLAALPLLLGVHQLTEAVVWLGQEGRVGAGPAAAARTLWAAIAYPLLPLLIPVAVLLVAASARRRVMLGFVLVGAATSAVLAYALAAGPVTADVVGHTVRYGVSVPVGPLLVAGYLIATVGALLASGQRGVRMLGVVCGIGALVCTLLWQAAFVSTWCALAALCSLLVLRWVRGRSVASVAEERSHG